jgi:DNA-binding IclR family transcriptional regulator
VKGEYLEMPGLALTVRQASRLWNLDTTLSQALLTTLVRERFLTRSDTGLFLRVDIVRSGGQNLER